MLDYPLGMASILIVKAETRPELVCVVHTTQQALSRLLTMQTGSPVRLHLYCALSGSKKSSQRLAQDLARLAPSWHDSWYELSREVDARVCEAAVVSGVAAHMPPGVEPLETVSIHDACQRLGCAIDDLPAEVRVFTSAGGHRRVPCADLPAEAEAPGITFPQRTS